MDRVNPGGRLELAQASADGDVLPMRAEEGAAAWVREEAVPRAPWSAPGPGEASPRTERAPWLPGPGDASRRADRAAATRFAEVAVTLPVPGRYHYAVPEPLAARAQVGARVLVRFGARKVTGVVVRIDTAPPPGIAPVALSDVLDEVPALSPELVELCAWIADYYEAPPGEVIRAALPAGSGIAARSVFALTPAGRAALDGEGAAMLPRQRALLARFGGRDLPAAGLAAGVRGQLAQLVAQGLVEHREQRDAARVRLKRERFAALVGPADAARTQVARAPRRLAVVELLACGEIAVAALEHQLPGARSAVRELVRLGLVAVTEREAPIAAAAAGQGMAGSAPPVLTDEQRCAVDAITAALRERVARSEPAPDRTPDAVSSGASAAAHGAAADAITAALRGEPRCAMAIAGSERAGDPGAASMAAEPAIAAETSRERAFTPFLLHGVTGSGKTEVYLQVIATALAAGRTALVLVPEISLTPQLAARFRARFGDLVAILHSGLSETARLGEWSRLRRGEARIAVGARSAVFAPLAGLGVIVVDEEHDGSFKQDEGVRYHARDVALVRAQRAGAVCVLGSATPSLESAAHAERGAYKKLTLTQRPTARPMPEVEIIDLRTYVPDGDAMLSAPLRTAIGEALAAGDQTILFLNRRGFATFVLCRACGHAFRCPHCSVSLTYHRHSDRLACHYCGFAQRVPEACPGCGATGTIERKGLGTEKVADAIATAFPGARVARLDRDVATGAKIEAVLARVARREVDVLVGTQMVTKGHDFPGVTLVGVLCADTGLNLPDFRASERTFQLLAQVAGRAGRGDRPGRVMIQTYRPRAPAVVAAAAHDYASFFAAEMAERADIGFPPHGRLVAVRIDGADPHEVAGAAHRLAELATAAARRPEIAGQVEVRGPIPAPLERLRNRTRWQVWLRSADRHALRRVARSLLAVELAGTVRVGLDVDPISAM
ncbi:MAG TPA: primosomal protein N' [Kofleriaceae bacterium]|nr:primosomal protein N' [Kofleriaceae bacterium]